MNKKMKKFMAIAAVIALGVVGLTGCGNKDVEVSEPIEIGEIAKEDRLKEVKLDKEIVFPTGEKAMLHHYIEYKDGHIIQYSSEDVLIDNYVLRIVGEDNLGNEFSFELAEAEGGKGGTLMLDGALNPEATTLTAGLYAATYEDISVDYKLVGEEFKIELGK